jgi:hypothetical protein
MLQDASAQQMDPPRMLCFDMLHDSITHLDGVIGRGAGVNQERMMGTWPLQACEEEFDTGQHSARLQTYLHAVNTIRERKVRSTE